MVVNDVMFAWVKSTDYLPRPIETVWLVLDDQNKPVLGWLSQNRQWWSASDFNLTEEGRTVTHWQYLIIPGMPKVE